MLMAAATYVLVTVDKAVECVVESGKTRVSEVTD